LANVLQIFFFENFFEGHPRKRQFAGTGMICADSKEVLAGKSAPIPAESLPIPFESKDSRAMKNSLAARPFLVAGPYR